MRFTHLPCLVLAAAWLASGCSGSGESDASDAPPSPVSTAPAAGTGDDTTGSDRGPEAAEGAAEPDAVAEPGTADDGQVDVTAAADPSDRRTVRVDFDINVPAYRSDELRVELVWGTIELRASWVGDEIWSASGDFPSETEHPLTVTFFDRNGDIALARFTAAFRTGSTASESFRITADQFDADQFDSDADGANNLAESIAGTDPSVDDASPLDIVDAYTLSTESRMSVSHSFEARLSDSRPLFDTFESDPGDPDVPGTLSGDVTIDAGGNGTLSYEFLTSSKRLRLTGTRTSANGAVTWDAVRNAYDGDYNHVVNVLNTVSVVDENTRGLVEEVTGSNIGFYTYRWETSTSLTGRLVDGTSLCEPVAGTISTTYRSNADSLDADTLAVEYVTRVTKQIGDPYWRIMVVNGDDETREYLARTLSMFRGTTAAAFTASTSTSADDAPEDALFICEFVDL